MVRLVKDRQMNILRQIGFPPTLRFIDSNEITSIGYNTLALDMAEIALMAYNDGVNIRKNYDNQKVSPIDAFNEVAEDHIPIYNKELYEYYYFSRAGVKYEDDINDLTYGGGERAEIDKIMQYACFLSLRGAVELGDEFREDGEVQSKFYG